MTEEAYVGQTQQEKLEKRMYGHKNAWRRMDKGHKGCRLLNENIKEYGWKAFRVEVLERPPLIELDAREDALIALHGTFEPNGLNILSGANDKPMLRAAVRARRAKTMEASEPRQRITDGVSAARKRCTPLAHERRPTDARRTPGHQRRRRRRRPRRGGADGRGDRGSGSQQRNGNWSFCVNGNRAESILLDFVPVHNPTREREGVPLSRTRPVRSCLASQGLFTWSENSANTHKSCMSDCECV